MIAFHATILDVIVQILCHITFVVVTDIIILRQIRVIGRILEHCDVGSDIIEHCVVKNLSVIELRLWISFVCVQCDVLEVCYVFHNCEVEEIEVGEVGLGEVSEVGDVVVVGDVVEIGNVSKEGYVAVLGDVIEESNVLRIEVRDIAVREVGVVLHDR